MQTKRKIAAVLATLMVCSAMTGTVAPVSAVSLSDTTAVMASAGEETSMVPLTIKYEGTDFYSSKEQAKAVGEGNASGMVSAAKTKAQSDGTLDPSYIVDGYNLRKRYYEVVKTQYETTFVTKMVDGNYQYKPVTVATYAIPHEAKYQMSVKRVNDTILSSDYTCPEMPAGSEAGASAYISVYAGKEANAAMKEFLKKDPHRFDEFFSEENELIIRTYWDYPSETTLTSFTARYDENGELKFTWVGHMLIARQFKVEYKLIDDATIEQISASYEGKIPFAIGADYHDEDHGLDYKAYYDGNNVDITVYNKTADPTYVADTIFLPGIGLAKGSNAIVRHVDGKMSIDLVDYYAILKDADKEKYSAGYLMYDTKDSKSFTPSFAAASVSEPLYHVVIENYDGKPITFGNQVLQIADKKFQVTEDKDSPFAVTPKLTGTLKDFSNMVTVKKIFDGSVAIDGKAYKTQTVIEVLRSSGMNRINVSTKFVNPKMDDKVAKFDYGKLIFATGSEMSSVPKSGKTSDKEYRLAQNDPTLKISKAEEAKSVIVQNAFDTHTLQQGTVKTDSGKEYYSYEPQYSGKRVVQDNLMALTFTPTYELTENGDDCYVIYGGQAYHIYVDLLQNDPVVIESIDTMPADTTGKMAYPTAKEELKSLIDASTPVFYEKSTETTPVSTTTATTSTTKVTTTNTTSVSTSATGSSSKEKETTVSSTTTITTTTTVTTSTTIAAETTVESTVPTETETTEAKTRKLGDVHYDDHIDIMDVIKMNKFILGTATIRKDELVYADIDKDGSVSATDSLWLLKRIVEMISEEDFNDIPGYLKKTNS